jgi:WhiB family transcriptional regulator, redox-sensing transcriptional regulator
VSELIMPPGSVKDGICGQVDPEIFHPPKGGSTREAKAICNGDPRRGTEPCTVLERCRAWAVETDQVWGIWGGLSARERRKLRGGEAAA